MTPGRSASLVGAGSALFGPAAWAVHFLVVYAAESLFCRLLDGGAHTLLLGVTTVVALIAIAAHARSATRRLHSDDPRRFLARVALPLDGLSAAAIGYVALAGLLLPACT